MNPRAQLSRVSYILTGGKSSRMGVDKAFLDFDGRTLLDRAIAAVNENSPTFAIVGDPAKFAGYGAVIADLYTDCGPLAGIHAALLHSSAELNLMLAVDMPFVTRELLSFLFATANETEATVIVPRTAGGIQPLCAVYRGTFGAAAEKALRAGNYKIDAVFADVTVRVIEEDELARAGFSERMFFNVNTPDDFRTAQK